MLRLSAAISIGILLLGRPSTAQSNTQNLKDLKNRLEINKTLFRSVSAKVHEAIVVPNAGPAETDDPRLNPKSAANAVHIEWGTRSGERNYDWIWSGDRTNISYLQNLTDKQTNREVLITNGQKQYSISYVSDTTKGGQGMMDRTHGIIGMPSGWAYQLENRWYADILDQFQNKTLQMTSDPHDGRLAVFRGETERGKIELDFSVDKGYIPIRQLQTLKGHLTEYRIETLSTFGNIYFPTRMTETRHTGDTLDSPVERTRTLTVSNVVFNQATDQDFDPHWREGMAVLDVEGNRLFKFKRGQLVFIGRTADRPIAIIITGLACILCFVLAGSYIVRMLVYRRQVLS